MIAQWERATNKQLENFTSDLDNYPEHVWNSAASEMEIKDSIVTESNAAVKRIRVQFLITGRTNRILVEKFLTAIYGSDFSKKGSREAEALCHMLITQAIKELLSSTVNSSTWEEKPHCMPAVQMWAKLCFKYEGVSDPSLALPPKSGSTAAAARFRPSSVPPPLSTHTPPPPAPPSLPGPAVSPLPCPFPCYALAVCSSHVRNACYVTPNGNRQGSAWGLGTPG
eukprot:1235757-Rhodomonas_salina.1